MNKILTQRQRVYDVLYSSPVALTRLQVAHKLGIERASVCRRVRELEEVGLLWTVGTGLDPITKQRASLITCNKAVLDNTPCL